MRRFSKTRRCTHCDTYNHALRLTCMVCLLPMPGVTRLQARAAGIVRRAAGLADTIGRAAFIGLTAVALVRRGAEVGLADLVPALAAYGLAQITVHLLDDAAEWIAPGPTWQEAAEALHETEKKLATSEDRAAAVDELNRYGGVFPVIGILRALALRSRAEKEAAEAAGDTQEALAQERMADALTAAAREMDADVERAWS
ncbi:hypothetical protein [Streptomyces sp.]|uniref:hypothetical protein n=1 Tax=Streptomyces sp. TaxID=1931 RepID=UPI0028121B56|nr:hypothetical protein [Streptomyces sp.]